MMNDEVIGEQFIRSLLRIILHKEFGDLKIVPQKFYNGNDTTLHGARLDVFVEEQGSVENATVYDIEPELKDKKELIRALPRRVRFYHAKIDAESLKAGTDYNQLKNVCVIMISPFDPFGCGRMIYTIQNKCSEEPTMTYEDGAQTLFLYTKGTKGNPPQELCELLQYMETTTEQNAVNPALKQIHGMVTQIKGRKEVALTFMKIFEKEQLLIQEGRDEMRAEAELQRQRAETAQKQAEALEAENRKLREELARLMQK